jgi:hypothetical protein
MLRTERRHGAAEPRSRGVPRREAIQAPSTLIEPPPWTAGLGLASWLGLQPGSGQRPTCCSSPAPILPAAARARPRRPSVVLAVRRQDAARHARPHGRRRARRASRPRAARRAGHSAAATAGARLRPDRREGDPLPALWRRQRRATVPAGGSGGADALRPRPGRPSTAPWPWRKAALWAVQWRAVRRTTGAAEPAALRAPGARAAGAGRCLAAPAARAGRRRVRRPGAPNAPAWPAPVVL